MVFDDNNVVVWEDLVGSVIVSGDYGFWRVWKFFLVVVWVGVDGVNYFGVVILVISG